MTPTQLAAALRLVAAKIDRSVHPSRAAVEGVLSRLAASVSREAAGTFHLRDSMLHIQRGDVESSSLPDDLKQAFLETLNVKNEVLRAIPQDRSRLDDDKAIDRLDSKAGSTVFAIKGLARQMSEAGMSIDSKTKSHIGELGKHGFVPGPHIPQEANDWVWNSHEVISKLFDIAEGKQDDD